MFRRTHTRPTAAHRAQLTLEAMEGRTVPSTTPLPDGGYQPASDSAAVVYVESNNPTAGQNAVLAYHRTADGALQPFGKFATGGTGELNQPKAVGPDDGDQQVQVTPDGRFLFAVNEGSNSVAAFRVRTNGELDRVGTFASGGDEPDSIGIAGNFVYVANRGNASSAAAGTIAPTVTAFDLNRDGSLAAIPGSTVTFPVGTYVTQTLVSPDSRFLFVEAATLSGTAGGNTLNPFTINGDGTLTAAPGGPASAGTNAPLLLGSAVNPNQNIIYAGFASSSQVGVFTYDATGRTTYVGPATDQGTAPCWCAVSSDGRVLYVANTVTDSVGVYSLADPLHPVQIQEFQLGGPRASTDAFQIALDPNGRYLYVVSQTTDPSYPQGNQLHTLAVARDGTVTEPNAPVIFPQSAVPADAHPQGVAVVSLRDRHGHDRGWHDWFDFGIDVDGRHHDRHGW
jgi:6-phosphogluconolactonase (cycloisomerase 2 family)